MRRLNELAALTGLLLLTVLGTLFALWLIVKGVEGARLLLGRL